VKQFLGLFTHFIGSVGEKERELEKNVTFGGGRRDYQSDY